MRKKEDYHSRFHNSHNHTYHNFNHNFHNRSNNDSFHDHCYCHHRSPVSIIFKNTIGFVIFVVLLSVAGIISQSINNPVYTQIVQFFNSNMGIFLILFLVGMINDIFWNFCFPANIFAPIISSVLSVFAVSLFYKIWVFIEIYIDTDIAIPINSIYIFVAVLTLIIGYIILITRETRERFECRLKEVKELKRKAGKKVEWEDIKEEFKMACYNFGKAMNRAFSSEKEKRSGKRKKKK
jgi:hypothetical protein